MKANSEGLACVTCVFPMSSATTVKGCVTLVHSVDKSSVLGVYSITRPVLSMSDATAQKTICLNEWVTSGRFGIAVFTWRSDGVIAQTPSTVVEFPNETKRTVKACDSECIAASGRVSSYILPQQFMGNIHAFSSLTVSSGVLLVGTCIAGMLITLCCVWHCKKKGISVTMECK